MKFIIIAQTFMHILVCSIAYEHEHTKSNLRIPGNETKNLSRKIEEFVQSYSIDHEPYDTKLTKPHRRKNVMRKIEESNQAYAPGSHCGTMAEDNYEGLPPYKDQILSFTAVSGREYKVPGDNEYLKEWNGIPSFVTKPHEVVYLRNAAELTARAALGNCTPTLDTLAWMMNKINSNDRGNNLMVAYGELIHLHREGDFVNKITGVELGDDIDMMASLETTVYIANLENELFTTHGWSMRAFVNEDGYTVFIQTMALCRHLVRPAVAKVGSEHPAIEIYPLAIVDIGNGMNIAKDLWQNSRFLQSQVYPVQCIDLESAGTNQTLHLQIPRKSIPMLECMYGNWQAPSWVYGGIQRDCTTAPTTPSIPSEADADACHSKKEYYDNTINDGNNLNFTSNNKTYYLLTNNTLLQKWNGAFSFMRNPGRRVTYLRNTHELVLRGKKGNCTSTLDVFAWLMDELNKRHLILMIAYGELIHVHREKDFVDSTTGRYIDDDIDTWASFETVAFIGALEEELFNNFGWSMRAFVTGTDDVMFIQMMATCGHVPIAAANKCISSQPAIEVYPLPIVDMGDGTRIIKDLWQASQFAETLIYPPKCITFQSSARKDPIHLQVPRESIKLLNCLYGNWKVKSSRHASMAHVCKDDTEIV